MAKGKAPERTWLLMRKGARLFEMTLPAWEIPAWDPPLETDRFEMGEIELYVDGKLAARGTSWSGVLAKAASKR